MMESIILIIFTALLSIILVYSLVQLDLLIQYRNNSKKYRSTEREPEPPAHLPYVTIQLPIFNEKLVVDRLLKNINKLQYPRHKLEIQVLDDSTDDSMEKTEKLVRELQERGLPIIHLTRTERIGFKAGALKAGLAQAKGELIAIFDSDFLPETDWLLRTVPYFKDSNVGVVQTRWGHLNRNYSVLTRLQAFLLDFHFVLEQSGRNAGGHFINFNGTAGIWRKQCILEAGNWSGDTLTEDLDLSFRAQLKGWKFKYLENVETPAELPITIAAARSQQFRWNKGAAENFQKNFYKLSTSPCIGLSTKIHGFFHLLNSSLFPLVLSLALLSIPLLFVTEQLNQELSIILSIFSLSTIIFFISYWTTYSRIKGKGWRSFFLYCGTFFMFFTIALGFSVHNSIAVIEGHLGKKSPFIRTPKFNVISRRSASPKEPVKVSIQLIAEGVLMAVFALTVFMAFQLDNYRLLLFHLMLFLGFSYVFFTSLHLDRILRKRPVDSEL